MYRSRHKEGKREGCRKGGSMCMRETASMKNVCDCVYACVDALLTRVSVRGKNTGRGKRRERQRQRARLHA